jgi:hypothetical protein
MALLLLLPGLALAAPTAGPCGHCEHGAPCATMAAPKPVAAAHSCCGAGATDAPAKPAPPTPAPKACSCGHDTPVAVAAAETPLPGNHRAEAPEAAVWCEAVGHSTVAGAARQCPPAPPPSPPIFLIDCVFLT